MREEKLDDARLVRREKRASQGGHCDRKMGEEPRASPLPEAPTSAPSPQTFSWETSQFSKDRDFVVLSL